MKFSKCVGHTQKSLLSIDQKIWSHEQVMNIYYSEESLSKYNDAPVFFPGYYLSLIHI